MDSKFVARFTGALAIALLAGCSEKERVSALGDADGATRDAGRPNPADGAVAATSADAGLDGYRAPPGSTALCLTFSHETIAPESESGLDQRGFLTIQVFDTPSPPGGSAASAVALYERTVPVDGASGSELLLDALPAPTIVLGDAPATVYVRALFFDNGGFNAEGGLTWGTWLGGLELSRGLTEDTMLTPVALTDGAVTMHDVRLVAMRRLRVTVTTSATPLGDGEGALSVAASRVQGLPPSAPTQGYGIDPCVDVTKGPQTVDMVLLGSGTFYVTAFFDDLGIETPGGMPPGTMLSVADLDLATGQGTFDQVTVSEEQYAADLTVDLGFVSAFAGNPDTIGPNSCADLGLPGSP